MPATKNTIVKTRRMIVNVLKGHFFSGFLSGTIPNKPMQTINIINKIDPNFAIKSL